MAVVGGWRPRLPTFGSPAAPPQMRGKAPRHSVKSVTTLGQATSMPEDHPSPTPSQGLEDRPALIESPTKPTELPSAPSTTFERRPNAAIAARWASRQDLLAHRGLPPTTTPDRPSLEGGAPTEAQSLAEALARWRRDNDAEGALTLLASHERRFAHGAFAVESSVAHAEILLALGRRSQALAVLDSLSLAGLPRARELQTIRGELRSQSGRCQEARGDLSHVLGKKGGDEFSRRAILAIAKCP